MQRASGIVLVVLALSSLSAEVRGNGLEFEWPHWRGPEMNGISREKGLVESWDPKGESLLWKKPELATRSTPVVFRGKLYTLANAEPGTPREGEKVICADAATGEVLWEHRFNVYLSDVPDTRVGWSSVVVDPETGHVFALGVCGHFACLDGRTGQALWEKSLCEEYGLLSTYGGRTNFPLVHGDLVIVSAVIVGWGEMARPAHRFIAFDKRNGQPVWFEGTTPLPTDTTYSSPVLAVVHGQLLMIFGSGDGRVHAFQPLTGKPVWSYHASLRGINTSPVVAGNIVVCGHSEENIDTNAMGALFAVDAGKSGDVTQSGALWRNVEMFVGKSSPIVVGERVYAIEDKGTLYVVDLKTGEVKGKEKIGTQGRASPLFADGKLYVCEANGRCFIYRPDPEKGLQVIERTRLTGEEIHGSPIVSRGRLYLPTTGGIYCFGQPDAEPQTDPIPAPPPESPISADPEPAQVQVVPVESLLRSGPGRQRQQFAVRLYNSKGQWLKTVPADQVAFSIEGPGDITGEGKYTAPAEKVHEAVIVTARVGELSGTARIRLVPDLDWSFDFDDGQIPVTWVGMRYRHIPLDFDFFTRLREQDPLAADLYIFLTSDFINTNQPKQVYNDATPQQRWTGLLRYLGLLESVRTLEAATERLEPSLNTLVAEKVLAAFELSGGDNGLQLTAERGPRRVEGNGVMCKISTIPLGTRSQGWMGPSVFSNHTIQADVYGTSGDAESGVVKIPDIGLQAQRYRLTMLGSHQQLELKSWISHDLKMRTVPFEWKPDVWYTLKFRAQTVERDGKPVALLQGKAWIRGEEEPPEWQIEWTDEPPNTVGSPGFFGRADEAEIFFDNVKVYRNEAESTE